jgi:LmbE family N-acetylglucosaminyl deacetylase
MRHCECLRKTSRTPHRFALLAAVLLVTRGARAAAPRLEPPALPPSGAATVLLVVAPHPDDETLCCGGAIQRVLAAGGRVSIVWLTSGDGSQLGALLIERSLFAAPDRMRAYGEQRMLEARAATSALGVLPAGQLFLGYPDGGLQPLQQQFYRQPYRSRFTNASAVPYASAVFPQHPYSGESLQRDFAAVLERVQPTLILAPSPLDSHPDHAAAGLLTRAATRERAGVTVRWWIVHGGEGWPSPRGLLPGIPLTPAPLGRGLPWLAFGLSVAEEDRKLLALRDYQTQLRVMEPFLLAFVRTTELFAPLPLPAAAEH